MDPKEAAEQRGKRTIKAIDTFCDFLPEERRKHCKAMLTMEQSELLKHNCQVPHMAQSWLQLGGSIAAMNKRAVSLSEDLMDKMLDAELNLTSAVAEEWGISLKDDCGCPHLLGI